MKNIIQNSIYVLTILFISNVGIAASSPTIAKGKNFKVTLDEFEKSYQQNLLFVTDKIVTKKKVLQDMELLTFPLTKL